MNIPAFETLLFEVCGHVALVSLNRPERLNAMNRAMLRELNEACDFIEAEDSIFVAVLTGEGKSFSSGFDLKEQAENTPVGYAEWRRALRQDFDAVMRFWNLSKPTIAAVRGHALAGGCELALACDITVAAENAVFGEPELKFGAGIVVMLLPWLTNPKLAKEIILTGEDGVPAAEAHRMGLVNRVVPETDVLDTAMSIAEKMTPMDQSLLRATKLALNRAYDIMGMGRALEDALDLDLMIEGRGTEDKARFLEIARNEGLRAAVAWRDARFEDSE